MYRERMRESRDRYFRGPPDSEATSAETLRHRDLREVARRDLDDAIASRENQLKMLGQRIADFEAKCVAAARRAEEITTRQDELDAVGESLRSAQEHARFARSSR